MGGSGGSVVDWIEIGGGHSRNECGTVFVGWPELVSIVVGLPDVIGVLHQGEHLGCDLLMAMSDQLPVQGIEHDLERSKALLSVNGDPPGETTKRRVAALENDCSEEVGGLTVI